MRVKLLVCFVAQVLFASVLLAQSPPGTDEPPEGDSATMDITTQDQHVLLAGLNYLYSWMVDQQGPNTSGIVGLVRYSECQSLNSVAESLAISLYDERELAAFRRLMIDSMLTSAGTNAGITVPESGYYGQYIPTVNQKAIMDNQKNIIENGVKPLWVAIEADLITLGEAKDRAADAMFYCRHMNKNASEDEICEATAALQDRMAEYDAALQAFAAKLTSFKAMATPLPAAINPLITLLININIALDDLHSYYLNRGYADLPTKPWR